MDEHLSDTRTWLRERIDGRLAAGVGIAWLVLLQVAFVLEPTPNQPAPAYGVVIELTMWLLLATMVTGLAMQRRWGLLASLGAAGFMTALSVACPVSGHHSFGAWWYGQMACVLALVATSAVALRWSGASGASSTSPAPTARDDVAVSAGDAASRG